MTVLIYIILVVALLVPLTISIALLLKAITFFIKVFKEFKLNFIKITPSEPSEDDLE